MHVTVKQRGGGRWRERWDGGRASVCVCVCVCACTRVFMHKLLFFATCYLYGRILYLRFCLVKSMYMFFLVISCLYIKANEGKSGT